MKFLTKFRDLQKCQTGEVVWFYGKVLEIEKTSKYNMIIFNDGTEIQRFAVYDTDFEVPTNKLYKFTGSAHGYDKMWFKLSTTDEVIPTLELERIFFPENFMKTTPNLQYIFLNMVSEIDNVDYRKIIMDCFSFKSNFNSKDEIYRAPASLNYHDNYKGGLINHIASMLNIARVIRSEYNITRQVYREIDWDLLYALIYLHDIGKPQTYIEDKFGKFKWNNNVEIDHATLGVCMVYNKCQELNIDVRRNDIQKLLKGIQQHMVKDSVNQIAEIQLLKLIDGIDAILATLI